jgi:ribosomal protein S3AE
MRDIIRKVITEELTSSDKSDIRSIFKTEFEKKLKSTEFKDAVKDIVTKHIGNDKKTQKEIASITQKVIVKLYKTFWTRRSFWANNLENI